MKYVILCLMLAASSAFADPSVPANDKKEASEQTTGHPVADGIHHNINTQQGHALPNASHHVAVAPSEFMSAPQYQPQPLPQNGPSPLYSLNPH